MEEKRKTPRQRALKKGRIVFNAKNSTLDCVVRNLSAGGARLTVTTVVGIPDTFELIMSDGARHHCRVAWRTATELGVDFHASAEG